MTLWDAVVMVLSFFGTPFMVSIYSIALIFLSVAVFITAPEVFEENGWVVIPWCVFGVMLTLFGISLLIWTVGGSTDLVSW